MLFDICSVDGSEQPTRKLEEPEEPVEPEHGRYQSRSDTDLGGQRTQRGGRRKARVRCSTARQRGWRLDGGEQSLECGMPARSASRALDGCSENQG